MANFYPKLAWSLQLPGKVHLRCQATTLGTLDQCTADSEHPAGLGFGDAALLLAPYFHLKLDDQTVGNDVSFTVVFRLPPDETISSGDTATSPKPTKHALELARQLAVTSTGGDQASMEMKWCADVLKAKVMNSMGTVLNTPESNAALEAFGQACAAALPNLIEGTAASYAATYSEAELADILAFLQSPSGKAWMTRESYLRQAQIKAEAPVWRSIYADAHARLCQKIAC